MKKFITLFVLISQLTYSQKWEKTFIKDEFGKNTTNKEYSLKTLGRFNNSAQQGAKSTLILSIEENQFDSCKELPLYVYFQVVEYSSHRANLYRKYDELNLAVKTSNNSIMRSTLLKNEYADNDKFTLSYYINPEKMTKQHTTKTYDTADSYSLNTPTYRVDSEIIEELLKSDGIIKFNIYTEYAEYYYEFNSLKKDQPTVAKHFLNKFEKRIEACHKEINYAKKLHEEKNNLIDSLLSQALKNGLSEDSEIKVSKELKKLETKEIKKIESITMIPLKHITYYNYNSRKIGVISTDIEGNTKRILENSSLYAETNSNFIRHLAKKRKEEKELTRNNIKTNNTIILETVFNDEFGGKYVIDEILKDIENYNLTKATNTINKFKFKISKTSSTYYKIEYTIKFNSNSNELHSYLTIHSRTKNPNFDFKKILKEEKAKKNKEYTYTFN